MASILQQRYPKNGTPHHDRENIVWSREAASAKRLEPSPWGRLDARNIYNEYQRRYHDEFELSRDGAEVDHDHDDDGDGDGREDGGNEFDTLPRCHSNELYEGPDVDQDGGMGMEYCSRDDFDVQDNFNYGHHDDNYCYHLDEINFSEIQRPHSLFEEECYYDADDEYHHVEEGVPIRQISIRENYDEAEHYSDDDVSECSEEEYHADNNCHKFREISKLSLYEQYEENSPQDVIHRIETVMGNLVNYLNRIEGPVLHEYKNPHSLSSDAESIDSATESISSDFFVEMSKFIGSPFKVFDNMGLQRVFTSITLVMSFIHRLLLSNRTTTTREVYYVFVTHFRNQKECDSAILDVARILGVPRRALGLSASPKGWFCGCVEITRRGTLPSGKDVSGSIDGTALSSIQGLPITREWVERDEEGFTEDGVEIKVVSKDAKVIVVIEKEGVYNRLAEERIFDIFPCILITGKGFPDLATRALVQTLHKELNLPVVGLCDSNPFGISVLALYHCAGDRMGIDGNMKYSVPIRWIGLRPSAVAGFVDRLPKEVFQKLTDLDYKRIEALLDETHLFLNEEREEEMIAMRDTGYKVELEALYWLGPDFMGDWVVGQLRNVDDDSEWEKVAI